MGMMMMRGRARGTYEVVLDELDGQGTLAHTTTTNDDKLVFSHLLLLYSKVYRGVVVRGEQ